MSGLLESLKLMYAHDATVLAGIENGSVRGIPLTQGKISLVDAEDYDRLSQYVWCQHKNGNTVYAHRNLKIRDRWDVILMHREIMGCSFGDGILIDHKDRNGLHNFKSNIRISNKSQNAINSKMKCNNTSGYRGVYFSEKDKVWRAELRINGKMTYLGSFDNKEAAAVLRDIIALKHRGEDAHLNFPEKRSEYVQQYL